MDTLHLLQELSKRSSVSDRVVDAMTEAAELIDNRVGQLEDKLLDVCADAPPGVRQACRQILSSGGKRIRPALCLLSFRAAGGTGSLPVDLAISCELLHNATLLHDDVIDEGDMRRGDPTARVTHGNAISVLSGDYLLVRTVEIVSSHGGEYMAPFAETLHRLVAGEVVQLKLRGSVDTTQEDYFQIIEGKTASLFKWAAQAGALAAGVENQVDQALGKFGWHVGLTFQIMDDVLDYTADSNLLGKSLLSDISEGKVTLPIILGSRRSSEMRDLLAQLAAGDTAESVVDRIGDLARSCGAVEDTKKIAAQHTNEAQKILQGTTGLKSDVVRVLSELSRVLLDREY